MPVVFIHKRGKRVPLSTVSFCDSEKHQEVFARGCPICCSPKVQPRHWAATASGSCSKIRWLSISGLIWLVGSFAFYFLPPLFGIIHYPMDYCSNFGKVCLQSTKQINHGVPRPWSHFARTIARRPTLKWQHCWGLQVLSRGVLSK